MISPIMRFGLTHISNVDYGTLISIQKLPAFDKINSLEELTSLAVIAWPEAKGNWLSAIDEKR